MKLHLVALCLVAGLSLGVEEGLDDAPLPALPTLPKVKEGFKLSFSMAKGGWIQGTPQQHMKPHSPISRPKSSGQWDLGEQNGLAAKLVSGAKASELPDDPVVPKAD